MANDPRFRVNCPSSERLKGNQNRNTLVDAISKVAGLDIDNKVVNGLKTLSSTYSVLSGAPIIGDGIKEVAAATGLPVPLGSIVEQFNPGVANQAYSAMTQIGQKIKQRDFKFSDIPQYSADLINFGKLASRIISPGAATSQGEVELCGISPYATDLIRLGGVKQKFLFVMEFIFSHSGDALSYLGDSSGGLQHTNGFAMFIKSCDRPTITYNYEDMNMYNLRTKVVKNLQYEPLNMVFYDDAQNRVANFLNYYLKSTSPMHRVSREALLQPSVEQQTMAFGEDTGFLPDYVASVGSTITNPDLGTVPEFEVLGPLAAIRLHHAYNYGKFLNVYTFIRPRFHQIQFDEVSMEMSDSNTVTVNFSYDLLHVDTQSDLNSVKDKQMGRYVLRNVKDASGDPVLARPASGSSTGPASTVTGTIQREVAKITDSIKKIF